MTPSTDALKVPTGGTAKLPDAVLEHPASNEWCCSATVRRLPFDAAMSDLPPPSMPPPVPPPANVGPGDAWLEHQPSEHQPSEHQPSAFVRPQFAAPKPPHDTLAWQAGAGAVAVLVVSLLASKFLLDALVGLDWPIVVYVVILGLVGYGPSVAWWLYATQRWGSGQPLADVGARPRWSDLGWGPVVWLAAIGTQVAVGALVLGFDIPISNNTEGIAELQADRSYVIALVITAVIAAPLVEEMVFRGLVMRSLLSRVGPIVAVPLQGVLFGVAHVDPVRGVGNIGLALVLSGVGCAFGGFAYMLRRIGPTIVAHALFNGVVMILVLTGVADRIRENNPDPFGSVVGEQIAVVNEADIVEPHRRGDSD